MFFDTLEQRALDFEILNDSFDNQIAVFDLCEVVVKVSGSHELRILRHEERRGFSFDRGLETIPRNSIANLCIFEAEPLRLLLGVNSRGGISSNSVGTPAFARCAAICAPIVPAPKTAAFSILIIPPDTSFRL